MNDETILEDLHDSAVAWRNNGHTQRLIKQIRAARDKYARVILTQTQNPQTLDTTLLVSYGAHIKAYDWLLQEIESHGKNVRK